MVAIAVKHRLAVPIRIVHRRIAIGDVDETRNRTAFAVDGVAVVESCFIIIVGFARIVVTRNGFRVAPRIVC